VQHATINNLAFGRSVDETLRVLQVCRERQQHSSSEGQHSRSSSSSKQHLLEAVTCAHGSSLDTSGQQCLGLSTATK